MSKECKVFTVGPHVQLEINTWLDLLGPRYRITHVTSNNYQIIVFVELIV